MKIQLSELRQLIVDEYTRGLAEWQLQLTTKEYVDKLREQILSSILKGNATSSEDLRYKTEVLDKVLGELGDEVHALLEDKLMSYIWSV